MTPRQQKIAARKASQLRIAQAQAEARKACVEGCPLCGRAVRHNLALTGWVQCQGYGAEGFRTGAPCEWQGFTQ